MKALVVGGEEKYVWDTIAKKLRTLGVEVMGHHGGKGKNKPLEGIGDAELVILMADTCQGRQAEEAKTQADRAGALFVSTSRKWAKMGLAVQTRLGHAGYDIPTLIKEMKDQPEPATTTDPIPLPKKAKEEAAREALRMVFEDRPELVLTPTAAPPKTEGLIDNPNGLDLERLAKEEAKSLRDLWTQMGGRGGAATEERKAEREEVLGLKTRWLARWLPTQDVLVTHTAASEECKRIFGGTLSKEAYEDVILSLVQEAVKPAQKIQPVQTENEFVIQAVRMPPDPEEFLKMREMWVTCERLGFDQHPSTAEYFKEYYDGKPPPEADGIEILKAYSVDEEIDVTTIPSFATHLRLI